MHILVQKINHIFKFEFEGKNQIFNTFHFEKCIFTALKKKWSFLKGLKERENVQETVRDEVWSPDGYE